MTRLWVRISNCSRDFLSMCGLRKTVYRSIRVGIGIGPHTRALVRLALSTISFADLSSAREAYASIRIRIRSPVIRLLPDFLPKQADKISAHRQMRWREDFIVDSS